MTSLFKGAAFAGALVLGAIGCFGAGADDLANDSSPELSPDGGQCAAFTPFPPGTDVDTRWKACVIPIGLRADGGLSLAQGTLGAASRIGDDLRLTCGDGVWLLDATIGCYRGPGSYDVPAGALELYGRKSDRVCRLDVGEHEGRATGLISCPREPENGSVFAHSQPPRGLGTFWLPLH